jgi:hypothetical protein
MKRAASIVCIALLVITVGASLGCGDGGGGSSGMTPKEVADAYMQASLNGDVDTIWELMSEEDLAGITKEEVSAQLSTLEGVQFDYELGEETIDGDTATVDITIRVADEASGQNEEFTDKMDLVKEGGEWKVSINSSSP